MSLQDEESASPEKLKRQRTLTSKALQNAIEAKQQELYSLNIKLKQAIQFAEDQNGSGEKVLHELQSLTNVFSLVKNELNDLFQQDKYQEYKDEAETFLNTDNNALNYAYILIDRLNRLSNDHSDKLSENASQRNRLSNEHSDKLSENGSQRLNRLSVEHSDKLSETASQRSARTRLTRRSRSSSTFSTSSSTRLRALAEAAAAKENAEYEQIMAEKENVRRQREAEEEKRREQERAQHERDMAILTANRNVAVANAKLRAIEEAIIEEETMEKVDLTPDIPGERADERTRNWVRTTSLTSETKNASSPHVHEHPPTSIRNVDHNIPPIPKQPFVASTPFNNVTGNQLIESLTSTNQQVIAGLARQNLPKCQPDVFNGDATLFHPWKRAFKAMIRDAEVSPEQEVNYLRNFTTGDVQRVVDNFRKRQHNPSTLLESLWVELERRFGSTAIITNALINRLLKSAAFDESNNVKLQEFADLCADVDSQITYLPGLACLNYPNAIQPIVERLPASLRGKWNKEVAEYAEKNYDAYPGFHNFAQLIEKQARLKNHPNILVGNKSANFGTPRERDKPKSKTTLLTNANFTEIPETKHCLFHERKGHNLSECKAFCAKPLQEKTDWIQKSGLCFRCLSSDHRARDCKANISCGKCGDKRHIDILHRDKEILDVPVENVKTKCTAICNENQGGLSCGKIVLIDIFNEQQPDNVHRVYAIVDDQSNTSMLSPELADKLGANSPVEKYYLSTCSSEREVKYGRRISNLKVRSLSGKESKLPTLVECEHIPRDKREIPTPELAKKFPHFSEIANEIPPLDLNAEIHLLLGRDAPELLKVRAFKNGPKGAPWAQKLLLGWTISGQACLDLLELGPVHVRARRTKFYEEETRISKLMGGRNTKDHLTNREENYEIVPCPNQFKIKQVYGDYGEHSPVDNVYLTTPEDNEVGLSCEDRKFLEIMDKGIHKNKQGNWEMPLPFRSSNVNMPNNRSQAAHRLNGLLRTLRKKPQMEKHYIEFIGKMLDRGHAMPVPPNEIVSHGDSGTIWYLPHFGVYHPKKPNQIRVVFDASAEYQGISLNKQLLAGPDLMNSLFGVLVRFRREDIAVMCDIEQMFHSFHVDPNHRDFLRFLWFEDNDPSKKIIEYRMTVHLFGNGSSPAVATYALRRTADNGEERISPEVKEFIHRNFYVDDGITSKPTAEEAIQLVKNAQALLATANLKLHKVVSNSIAVMEAIPTEDRGKDVRDLDLRHDSLPAQRSLGVYWDLENDAFTFRVSIPDKPFTRRGVLSVVNSIYDPLGLAVPVILEGRLLLQQLVIMGKKTKNNTPLGWDDPLPDTLLHQWKTWRNSLVHLEKLQVPRCYHPRNFGNVIRSEIHAFSDASTDAIGTVIYLRLINEKKEVSLSFLYGQTRVAPVQVTSIPRLELCGAVLTAQAVNKILKEIDLKINDTIFYTDSKVILGYIQNESRRFFVYVANRVQIIRGVSSPSQWRYVETSVNPADLATRKLTPANLTESSWLSGPSFLKNITSPPQQEDIQLDENDPEVRREVIVCSKVTKKNPSLGSDRFSRFSSLSSLQRAIANLIIKIREFKRRKSEDYINEKERQNKSPKRLQRPTVKELEKAIVVIIRETQKDTFGNELQIYAHISDDSEDQNARRKRVSKQSQLHRLDPFIDSEGILRVGGRLRRADLEYGEKHPILLPKGHHVSQLVVRHYHKQVHHQGRQITHSAIRQGGYWIIGGHRIVAKELHSCITCKKLRGPPLEQRMADLPRDRTEVQPPFTYVGFDVFGPWTIKTRRTRGGAANSKRWGLVFTCLNSRAVHVEVLETMDADSFICALRRFFAIRGPASRLRCDRGTNFVGGKSELDEALKEMDQSAIERYVTEHGCEWVFNPPHASHFGGVWERQIGTIRRVLDAMFLELGGAQLTHELLCTLMAEVTAIVNARPITTIPSDVDEPQPLTPAMILTMKTRPLGPPPGNFVPVDLYTRHRWRRVQYLANQFWVRWKREYLQNLQVRQKWRSSKRDLTVGDIVLVREDTKRNDWPLGLITSVIKSEDEKVRKVSVTVAKDGKRKLILRPIKELTLLVPTSPP